MSGDIQIQWDDSLSSGDFSLLANDLESGQSLQTAVLISLFSDRRGESGDVLPDGQTDRRGWWADAHPDVEGDQIGSRLWLLARAKTTPEVLDRAQDYARESLQWMIDDKVASRVEVTAEFFAPGSLGLTVTITRPTGDATRFRFGRAWASLEGS